MTPTVTSCRIITFPKISDERGNLSFIHGSEHIPFEVMRVYYLYDVPGGSSRGGHAHRNLAQVLIPLSGSFDVVLRDGCNRKIVTLNRPFEGLLITPMIWRELENFSSGAVCLVLASRRYDERDYIRDYAVFSKEAQP